MSNAARFAMSPVFMDGLLYVLIAVFMFMQTYLSGDEAAKYIAAATIFWLKFIVGSLAAGVGALKMFRSTTYSDHLKEAQLPPKTP